MLTGSSATIELRVEDERARDDDPLALAARELVRVAEGEVGSGPQAGGLERRHHPRLALARAGRDDLLDLERLGHEVVDRLLRVERLVRVLEDQLDAAPVVAQPAAAPDVR